MEDARPFRPRESEMTAQKCERNSGGERTAETSRTSPAPAQQLPVRSWDVCARFTVMKALAQWRARTRNELTTLSERHVRDIRRTRAEVEAERSKAFWWA
jgi:uncharacterized protein YjiS (DUF1127 family)